MRSFDLSPLFRYSVGFDRLDDLFETAFRNTQEVSYPPYNIVKTGQDNYKITLAVAGFGEEDLDLVVKENVLTVRGKNDAEKDKDVTYLHRGIAGRSFEHRFQLADHVRVNGANLANGLLDIELVRELPEAMKPQRVEIGAGSAKPKVIEARHFSSLPGTPASPRAEPGPAPSCSATGLAKRRIKQSIGLVLRHQAFVPLFFKMRLQRQRRYQKLLKVGSVGLQPARSAAPSRNLRPAACRRGGATARAPG
jgi:molecular chaperone IbpA